VKQVFRGLASQPSVSNHCMSYIMASKMIPEYQ